MADIMASVQVVHDEPGKVPSVKEEASQEPHFTSGLDPNTQIVDFIFKKEVECLPFNLIYSYQEVFSLHDEDLGYCD